MKKEQHDPGPRELGEKSLGVLQHRVRVERMGSPRVRGPGERRHMQRPRYSML